MAEPEIPDDDSTPSNADAAARRDVEQAPAAHPASSPFMSNASPAPERATAAAGVPGDADARPATARQDSTDDAASTTSPSAGAPVSDASDATAVTPPNDPPRRRLTVWKAAVPLVTMVAGLMFVVSSHTAQGGDLRSDTTDLADVVRRADHRVKTKQASVAAMRAQVDAEQKTAATKGGNAARVASLTKAADKAQDPAGLAPMTGTAVSVTLNDSKEKVEDLPANGTPDWLVVHQQDVQAVVNALWAGGARGMMLMDQRIVATSAVRCVGNTLILQGRVYSPPFTITAVGDPVKLKAALDGDASVKIYRQYVDLVGLGYDVKEKPNTTLPAFTGPVAMKFAKTAR